jgi:hypothetical protein
VLTEKEITETFVNTKLEENYNFLKEDLVKLANAFVDAAKEKIALEERAKCVKIAKDLNLLVGIKIEEVRRDKCS